jgi:formate dehydrogenase gamma subunit
MKRILRFAIDVRMMWMGLVFLSFPHPGAAQGADDPCLMCHSMPAMFEATGDPGRYVVTQESLAGSVHGPLGISCSSCHQNMEFPHPENPKATCSPCHAQIEEEFAESLHGYALARGNERAPDCSTCHGTHDILPSSDPRAATHKVRLPNTCAQCHGEVGLLTDQYVRLPQSFQQYALSVHGRGTSRGVAAAASCSDCHSVHAVKGAADPESRINPRNVASTCGQCHPDVQLQYDQSIHGRALQAGVTDSPTCTDCHGEHLILSPSDPDAKVSGARQAIETCGECHNDPLIISKYGLQGGVVGTYLDSYHGWATRRGDGQAATCIDCHSAHLVLPAEDPASTVSAQNVVSTCAQCHEGANAAFAASYNHQSTSITENPVNRFIRKVYIWLIVLVIGGMVLHNMVIMNYYMIRRRKEQSGNGATVVRFTVNEILQHLALTLSFITLVITGFALRFPEAFWVQWLSFLGMSEDIRGNIHRVAGVALILTSAYHAWYVLGNKRGRTELKALFPSWRDVVDAVDNLLYYTFRSKRKVKFGRYDYSQKAEYWALVWGTIVMAITGLVLWFPTFTARHLPALVIPASQTVHYYEAWLATLAVIVWHFFFVMFHPEEYPMSWTWLTGKMSKKFVKEHHTQWYEEEIEPLGDEKEEQVNPVSGD